MSGTEFTCLNFIFCFIAERGHTEDKLRNWESMGWVSSSFSLKQKEFPFLQLSRQPNCELGYLSLALIFVSQK